MLAMTKPTSPTPRLSTGSGLGEKMPTWSMSYDWPLIIIVTFMPARMVPSMTRIWTMTPR